ncbi:MFS transporter [Pseudohongiella spirulinae]|uniref:MFS transporter n=1 Tax=Pseudohongiella spirulinae TaxID=1249552 RepID=UPI0014704E79|nr:MFS transporter [Pseudohongiella spirulinae]
MNREQKLKRNINVVYGLAFFHMFMLIVPVMVPFFQSKGLSLAEIFYLQALYAAGVVLLEAPSGYLADVLGRRIVLLIGASAHGVGYLWLNFAEDFTGLLIFEMLMAVAVSMVSGADLALLYDSERALAREDSEHTYSVAHLGFMKSLAEGTGALMGGALAMISFDLMVLVQSLTAWVCLWMALMVTEPPGEHSDEPKPRSVSLQEIWNHLIKGDRILKLVFIALPVYNLATIHVAWLIQPYWDDMGLSLALFGALWFAQSLTVALASKCGYLLEKSAGAVRALIVVGVLPAVGIWGMAMLNGWTGVMVGFVLFFCRGLYQVILVNALNRRIPDRFRATINSMSSLIFRFGFILTGPLIGFIADKHGLQAAFSALGIMSVISFVLIMLPLIMAVRKIAVKALPNLPRSIQP